MECNHKSGTERSETTVSRICCSHGTRKIKIAAKWHKHQPSNNRPVRPSDGCQAASLQHPRDNLRPEIHQKEEGAANPNTKTGDLQMSGESIISATPLASSTRNLIAVLQYLPRSSTKPLVICKLPGGIPASETATPLTDPLMLLSGMIRKWIAMNVLRFPDDKVTCNRLSLKKGTCTPFRLLSPSCKSIFNRKGRDDQNVKQRQPR